MERNQLFLFLIFFLSLVGSLIGVSLVVTNLSNSKYSLGTAGGFFSQSGIGAVVVVVQGEIHSGESTYDSTGSDTLLRELRDIGENSNIKGILLEINSPGGTVAASQEIFHELMVLRKTKKIVVSMKDVAASGGYYIASAADSIFAQNGTITGSIGVISFSPNVKNLLEKYGVSIKTYKAGKYKDIFSPFRDATSEEEDMIGKQMQDTYRRFVEDVAQGRNRTVKSIEELAEGKIYSGEDAFRNKLVDDIGGRREAHQKLSELCQYEGLIPLFEKEADPWDKFFQAVGGFTGKSRAKLIFESPTLVILPSALHRVFP